MPGGMGGTHPEGGLVLLPLQEPDAAAIGAAADEDGSSHGDGSGEAVNKWQGASNALNSEQWTRGPS